MSELITILNSSAVGLFGSILSASFAQVLHTPRNRRSFCICVALLALLQVLAVYWLGAGLSRQLYPLLVHFPLFVLLCYLTRRPLWSGISVLTAYLCCQLRRWLALLTVALLHGGATMQSLVELILTVPLLFVLLRLVSPAVRRLSEYPAKRQCQFGAIPAVYYAFDYVTVVYTDLLASGAPVAVEFMPFVCCGAYLVFLLHNSAEEQRYSQLQQLQKGLDLQLRQSVREITALRESQALARQYRHDLRHHLQYVSACIANGQPEQAQAYIRDIDRQIESQKVRRYCENETANLILSAFDARAKKDGVALRVQGALPAFALLSDSDLCVLLSNALENALHACQPFAAAGAAAVIDVQFYAREGKLFLQVSNPCVDPARFENGLPVSDQPGHGIGVQSICAIVEKYGGVYAFLVKDGQFIVRLSL